MDLSSQYNINLNKSDNIRKLYNDLINKYYQNETIIKSNFLNNILFNYSNNTTIFEFKLDTSRADLCNFNKYSTAYEIKTDLDNFLRLNKQVNDYSEIFEEVYIICSKHNLSNISKLVPIHCGIYTYSLTKNYKYKFKRERKALLITNLNSKKQLSLLTTSELKSEFAKCKNSLRKKQMIDLILASYSPKYINSKFKSVIKRRYNDKWTFLKQNYNKIYEIDYQWFFKNNIAPEIIYQ
ncbi:hypothetical protein BH721_01270 [Clostridium baratii]|nr:hypothetical protein BH721_01270 [Clostridium baratii]OPF57776.1 hypothetical protein BH724_08525 [Clostridium baratii]OPF60728.1 hypothetical protein BH725_06655 [Clostridium baratii]